MFKQILSKMFKCQPKPLMGRWDTSRCPIKENITILNTNRDNCGDSLCGDPKENKKMVDELVIKD